MSDLLDALLEDLPYDLYWFDKTSGVYSDYYYDQTVEKLYFLFGFCVSEIYRTDVYDDYFTGAKFGINISATGAATSAAANAKAVVNQAAAKKTKFFRKNGLI